MALFFAHRTIGATVPTYFIESTAPNNVDDPLTPPFHDPRLELLDADAAIERIADELAHEPNANLVFLVHGFNNPEPVVLPVYAAASAAVQSDPAINSRAGLVCVGYRWPSESMGQPRKGVWGSLPLLPIALLWSGIMIFVFFFGLYLLLKPSVGVWQALDHLGIMTGWVVAGLIITAILLRLAVYFRDNYRAQVYGAPDLIEIIRQIDAAIVTRDKHKGVHQRKDEDRVQLSFIGHSMEPSSSQTPSEPSRICLRTPAREGRASTQA